MKRLFLLLLFPFVASGAALDATPFGKAVKLTIPAGAVSEDLADFPVLVRLSTASGFSFSDFGTPADELRFATADGENLDYEIDTWNATSGGALVWVSLPVVPAAGTNFFAWFAPDASASLPAVSPTAVWTKAGYLGVWHFSPASGGVYANSAQPSHYATPSAAATERTDGAVGGCVKPASGSMLVNDSVAWAGDTPHMTVEAWVDRLNGGDQRIFGAQGGGWENGMAVRLNGYIYGNGMHSGSNLSIPASGWQHVSVNFSSTEQANALVNGTTKLTFWRGGGTAVDGNNGHFFHNTAKTGTDWADFSRLSLTCRGDGLGQQFTGLADEFRLRGVNSSPAWMKATYDTQAANPAFLSCGPVSVANARIEALSVAVSSVSWTDATVTGSFQVAGSVVDSVDVSFVFDSGSGTASATAVSAAATTSTATLSGLAPNTSYTGHFSIGIDGVTIVSDTVSFTTTRPPAPETEEATWTGVRVTGSFAVEGAPAAATAVILIAPEGGAATSSVPAVCTYGGGVLSITNDIADLLPGTTYAVRFSVVRDGGAAVPGAVATFDTEPLPAPVVSAVGDTNATATAAFSIPASEVYTTATAVFETTGVQPVATRVAAGSFAAGLTPSATVWTLSLDTEYKVRFELSRTDGATVATPDATFFTSGSIPVPAASYAKSLAFRVSGYEGTSTLTNFPALLRLSASTPGFSYADVADPSELRFSLGGGRLDHEVETWNPDGESLVWVSIRRLPPVSRTNTVFTMHYKPVAGESVPEAPDAKRVWLKAGYVGVWHLAEKKDGAFPDSAGLAGSTSACDGDPVAVQVGNGAVGNGRLVVASDAFKALDFSDTGVTFETWLVPAAAEWRRMFEASSGNDGFGFSVGPGRFIRASWTSSGKWSNAQNAFVSWVNQDAAALRHFAASFTPEPGGCRLFEDGVSGGPFNYNYGGNSQHLSLSFPDGIGLTSYLNGNQALDQPVDEIRVRARPTDPDWGAANWKTMASGRTFIVPDAAMPSEIAVSDVGTTSASVAGTFYAPGGASVRVVFATAAGETNRTAATDVGTGEAVAGAFVLSNLKQATDYAAWFEVDGVGYPALSATFTTDGYTALDKSRFNRMYTFNVSTNLPAGTELENFPVLVRISTNRIARFTYDMCAPDGSDIRFSDSSGRSLPMEVEHWNANGESLVWVSVPVLDRRTHFMMHCGVRNPSKALSSPMTGYLWGRAGYRGVWHMNKTEGFVLHGSVPGVDGHANSAQNAPTAADFVSGGVTYAAPVGPYIVSRPNVRVFSSQMSGWNLAGNGATVEFWALPTGDGRFFASGTGPTSGGDVCVGVVNYYQVYGSRSGGGSHTSYAWPEGVSGWRHAQFVYGREGQGEGAAYVNGASASANKSAFWQWGEGVTDLGLLGWSNGNGGVPAYPADELRVREGLSTPEWALAVYLSMADPDFVVGGFNPATLMILR